MKIAIISLDDSISILVGGKHIHQQLLKKGLELNNHEVEYFFPQRTNWYLLTRVFLLCLNKLKIIKKSYIYKWTLSRHTQNIRKQIKKNLSSFNYFLCQDPVSAVAASNINDQTRIVLTLHGYLSLESINYVSYNKRDQEYVKQYALYYEKKSLDICHKLITVDTRIADYIKDNFQYPKEIKILKNAINPELFGSSEADDIEKLKRSYSVGSSQKIVLVPRRLVKKNGVEVAIRALHQLISEGKKDICLWIMGDGPLLKELKSLAQELKVPQSNILFLGSIPHQNVPKYYDTSDIVLIPSVISDGIEEATSLSMLEGMAAKKIVITSNIGGMKEVIKPRVNGFLFEQGDYNELSKTLEEVFSFDQNKIREITNQAYRDVCEKHHYTQHALDYIEEK